jgi:cell division protein FtsW (lipid II flippase)
VRRLLPGWIGWPQLDVPLLLGLLGLMAAGLIVLYSASGGDINAVYRQAYESGLACSPCWF